MVKLQHLQHPRSRGGGYRQDGGPRLRLEGRDRRGVHLVHRANARLPRRQTFQHDSRRRRRPHQSGAHQVPSVLGRLPRDQRRDHHWGPQFVQNVQGGHPQGSRDQRQRLRHKSIIFFYFFVNKKK
jgi:hypothetical protein